jgi:hypothetical protein
VTAGKNVYSENWVGMLSLSGNADFVPQTVF